MLARSAGRQFVPFKDGCWCDPAGARTHDLPHERQTPLPLSLPDAAEEIFTLGGMLEGFQNVILFRGKWRQI